MRGALQGRNDEDMPYQCPACLKQGLAQGLRHPITTRPQSMLEAAELPRCHLSDHIQKHLDGAVAGERPPRPSCPALHTPCCALRQGVQLQDRRSLGCCLSSGTLQRRCRAATHRTVCFVRDFLLINRPASNLMPNFVSLTKV